MYHFLASSALLHSLHVFRVVCSQCISVQPIGRALLSHFSIHHVMCAPYVCRYFLQNRIHFDQYFAFLLGLVPSTIISFAQLFIKLLIFSWRVQIILTNNFNVAFIKYIWGFICTLTVSIIYCFDVAITKAWIVCTVNCWCWICQSFQKHDYLKFTVCANVFW